MITKLDTTDERIELDADDVGMIRKALLIGLASFGEIERLEDAFDVEVEVGKTPLPDALRPQHPTGSPDAIGEFATALRLLDV